MGTSAKVSIRIRPESKGLIKFHVKEWRDKPNRGYYDTECNLMVYDNIMSVYINYDGYLEGVGSRLFKEIRSYKEAFEFIVQGDRRSFDTPYYECNEPWAQNKPKMSADYPDGSTSDDYYYRWDIYDGEEQWLVRKHSESEYTPLRRFFSGLDIVLQSD